MRKLKCLLIVLILLFILEKLYIPEAPEHIKKMVLDNRETYTSIAKLYYDDYLECEADVVRYSCLMSEGIYRYTYPESYIELNKENIIKCGKITDTYGGVFDRNWDSVVVYSGYVTFGNETRYTSLVYSVNGKRPKFINSPVETIKNVRCSKINDNWYYMQEYCYYEYLVFMLYDYLYDWWYLIIVVILIIVVTKRIFDHSAPKDIRFLVKHNKDRFSALALLLYSDFRNNRVNCAKYITENGEVARITEPKHILKISENAMGQEMEEFYRQVGADWDVIYVYKYYVLFRCKVDGKTLIYSIDNIRPCIIKIPYVKFVICKKIRKHWYYTNVK